MNEKEFKVPLTSIEKAVYNFNRCGECNVIGLTIVQISSSSDKYSDYEKRLNEQLAKKALVYLIKRHPLMRANIEADSTREMASKPYDTNMVINIDNRKRIDQECFVWNRIDCSTRQQVIERLEDQCGKLFDFDRHDSFLWRFMGLEFVENEKTKFALSFVIPLCFCDGLSICSLLLEFVNLVNSLLLDRSCIEMEEKLDLADNIDQLIEKHNLFKPSPSNEVREPAVDSKLPCKFRPSSDESGIKINLFKMNESQTKTIVDYCKQNRIKVTGILTALFVYALKDLYEENDIRFHKDFAFGVATNLRFRVKPAVDNCHLRYYTTLVPIEAMYPRFGRFDDMIADAFYLNELIHEATRLNETSSSVLGDAVQYEENTMCNDLFDDSTLTWPQIGQLLGSELRSDVIISNAGTYLHNGQKMTNTSAPFYADEMYFGDSTRSIPQIEQALLLHSSYWNGQIMFMLTSNRRIINSQFTDRLVQLVDENVQKLCTILD